jgi:hypothetical protein
MGIDYTTYVGPHVVCKLGKKTVSEKIRSCTNASCEQHKRAASSKFCSKCGSPIDKVEIPKEVDTVNAHNVRMDLLGEALYDVPGDDFHFWMRDNNTHIWLANRKVPDTRSFSFDRHEIQNIPLTTEIIAAETEKFVNFYEKELFILRQEYGEENVSVVWGLIHYIS